MEEVELGLNKSRGQEGDKTTATEFKSPLPARSRRRTEVDFSRHPPPLTSPLRACRVGFSAPGPRDLISWRWGSISHLRSLHGNAFED